jgi:cyclase
MLTALRQATPTAERITTVVDTHANGDHCYGNALEMAELPASVLAAFMRAAPDMGDLGAFLLDIFGALHFDGIELVAPTRTFTGQLDLRVGDRQVQLIEIGPAHTAGDVIVHVPATPGTSPTSVSRAAMSPACCGLPLASTAV